MVAEVTFNGKLYYLGNESCRGSQESYLTRKSSVNVVLQYDTKWGTWLKFFFLLFPFVFSNYFIFEKRSRFRFWNPTFQCASLSRLAKIRLRESPKSKMTRVKYNWASLCNIVKERTAWDIMTHQYIINDRHDDHRNPTKRTSSEIIYLNFIAWSHIMDITLLSTQSGKAYSMSAK